LVMMAATSRARALWCLGEIAASRQALLAGATHSEAYPLWFIDNLGSLALLEAWAGNLSAARRQGTEALAVATTAGLLEHPAVLDVRNALAHVCRQRGDQRRAADLLAESAGVLARTPRPITSAILTAERALLYLAAGQPEEGLSGLAHHRAERELTPPPIVDARLRAIEARLLLSLGDLDHAEAVLEESPDVSLCPELSAAGVQAAVARRDLDLAGSLLDKWVIDEAQPSHGLQHRLWSAVVAFENGDRRTAVQSAAAVVAAAGRQGDIRFFLDGGRPVERLLRAVLHAGPQPHAERVLRAARRAHGAPPGDAAGLSRRELEVVRYLPTSLSSAEIAERLYISLNTLKTHLRTIYTKLEVTNRREAIEHAKDLGIA